VIRKNNVVRVFGGEIELPLQDNTSKALAVYRAANERFRQVAWPKPFNKTTHMLSLGDARDLSAIPESFVHLVATMTATCRRTRSAASLGSSRAWSLGGSRRHYLPAAGPIARRGGPGQGPPRFPAPRIG
jgi:hypothetical protein